MGSIKYQNSYVAYYQDKFDMINADIDRRFNIVNTLISNKFLDHETKINKNVNDLEILNNTVKELKFNFEFNAWKNKLPWYKILYYTLFNINLIEKFKTVYYNE